MKWLTFKLTATTEAADICPDCDDATNSASQGYDACLNGSGVEQMAQERSKREALQELSNPRPIHCIVSAFSR